MQQTVGRYENFGFGADVFAEAFETLGSVVKSYEWSLAVIASDRRDRGIVGSAVRNCVVQSTRQHWMTHVYHIVEDCHLNKSFEMVDKPQKGGQRWQLDRSFLQKKHQNLCIDLENWQESMEKSRAARLQRGCIDGGLFITERECYQ